MNMLETLLQYLPSGVMVLALAVIFCQHRRLARLQQRLQAHVSRGERAAAGLRKDLTGLMECNRGVREVIHEHQRHLRQLLARQDNLELHDFGEARYGEAATLIKKGASPEDLIESCGLSRGEADLVVHLSQLRKAS